MPHTEVEVIDPETGAQVERGTPGELCTRGYCVMAGYWNDPEKTAEAIDGDGWMHTGDIAVMDDEGYLAITGRIKDMVIRGGENIYPREVEEFLYGHPDIVDAQVVGVPDEKYGEELMAWIRVREGAEPPTAEEPARVLCRPDRPQQDSALRPGHRRVPDDGDGQGQKGGAARARRGDARGRTLTGRHENQGSTTVPARLHHMRSQRRGGGRRADGPGLPGCVDCAPAAGSTTSSYDSIPR